jgi:hypothetical protein
VTPEREGPVVTLDGPAGSGKSTTAKEVARRLGLRHLDSGALYRALTFALLEAGVPEAEWERLGIDDLRALGVELGATEAGFEVRLGGRVLTSELRGPGSRSAWPCWRGSRPRARVSSISSGFRALEAASWPTGATWVRWSFRTPT